MKTRKILSAFLVCVMIVCAMSVTAFAETEVANFGDLKTALANAENGDVIKLSSDITATEAIKATDVIIDLCGNTLQLADNSNNYLRGTTTIKNGTISVNDVQVAGDCIMGFGDGSNDATVKFENVNITGSNYSSAFAVLMVYGDSTLNIENGEWALSNEQSSVGGVIKNENGAGNSGKVNISGTKMTFDKISRGISGSTAVLDGVKMTITGGDNGINGAALTVKNSTLNISGGTGRALTVTNYDVVIENSTLNFSNNTEADIRFKTANTLSIDDASTLSKCTVFANAEGAKINGTKVTGTEDAPSAVFVENGETTITDAVASVGNKVYFSFAEALNAAVATKGGNVTVKILDNIDLTYETWTPVYFDSYSAANANTIVIEGNNKIITGLSDMMFSGVWKGDKLEIRNLTLDKANIVNDDADTENKGVGAFVGKVNAVKELVITNCKLTNSHVEGGHWTGGFVGYAAGYSGNDGPVFTEITVEGCSVENSTITGKGSVGGIVGHATGDAWTSFDVETTNITKNTITSTGSSKNKAGIVMGTIGAAGTAQTTNGTTLTGGVKVAVTENGNTATSNETAITTVYGRQGNATSVLTITGGTYANNPIEENVSYAAPAEGFEIVKNENGTFGVVEKVEETDIFGGTFAIINMEPTMEGHYLISIYSGIDSLNYKEVGFEIHPELLGYAITESTNTVYTSITVPSLDGSTSQVVGLDKVGNAYRMFGTNVQLPVAYDNSTIYYRAYAIDLSGNPIYGGWYEIDDIYTLTSEEVSE